ncbi:hypothetical protein [Gryllotalpicola protaetiae]|uniref:UDP-N-acetylglucosamine--peptide N-acetylglucosaminyltransferase stabilizing protein GtfB n=1 Tax=Gryllotalpicola protaetiae TaxID=2419771 RepID=A0A387BSV8_9MICO|nr:hypothetical protein [Gryllotalpicola protaetiae]AYG05164.1 hypothetical protein D7I44_17715 [Gryllotalpicola protaetiae]
MLALFDTYDDTTRELLRSFETAAIEFTPVVIQYGGELPDGALCPFTAYTGIERNGAPLFFDQVPVPEWCEIRHGRELYGQILRDGVELGRINYEPNSFRQVESVDWLLPDGSPSHTDRYDRYGNRYATTFCSVGVAHQTVYRGPGEWVVEVDHASRLITMRSASSLRSFASLADFVSFFIDDQRLEDDRVVINSLSHPLFVMRRRAATPNTTLFWQEPMPGDEPENMATELADPRSLERIVFSDERMLQRVSARHPETPVELVYLSQLGRFADRQGFELKRTFTLTNSDELPGLAELLEAFPEITFSVAALTLMSDKLHDLGRRYPNLTLTPGINQRRIREEFERASVYLDLNAGSHVLDVVKAAYHLNLVVLALRPNAKAPEHSLVVSSINELRAELDAATATPRSRNAVLARLHTQRGPQSTAEEYLRVLSSSGRTGST